MYSVLMIYVAIIAIHRLIMVLYLALIALRQPSMHSLPSLSTIGALISDTVNHRRTHRRRRQPSTHSLQSPATIGALIAVAVNHQRTHCRSCQPSAHSFLAPVGGGGRQGEKLICHQIYLHHLACVGLLVAIARERSEAIYLGYVIRIYGTKVLACLIGIWREAPDCIRATHFLGRRESG